jgi:hypothetical protein
MDLIKFFLGGREGEGKKTIEPEQYDKSVRHYQGRKREK